MKSWRKTERQGMNWLIAGVLLIVIVAMLVRLKKSESGRE